MSELFVGIDGGGTRATALVTDRSGRALARVQGSAALVLSGDPAAGAGALADLCRKALGQADGAAPATALCCALAGAGRPEQRAALRRALDATGCARAVMVTGDVEAAVQDAFGAGPGLLLVAGTGSIACGRDRDGTTIRVGGWGSLLGDEGSGYAIGLAALRAAVRAADGRGPATSLLVGAMAHARVRDAADLIPWADASSKGHIAGLAPAVFAAAAAGDDAAVAIVDEAALALAAHITTLARRLGLPVDEAVDVALTGGLIAPGGPLRQAVVRGLARSGRSLHVLERDVDGARGAAALARSAAGA